ncbi:MAG: LPP20 family lipoprotein [Gammaproteobacteria bacterium]|nr:LPP20 family lipoprotein [Gammaproteobacteria bacterium]
MRKFLILVLVTTSLVACKTQAVAGKNDGKKPDWVNSESFDYPHSAYIVGKGSASDRKTANSRALANLSKTFEAKIQEETRTLTDIKSHNVNGKENFSKDIRLLQDVTVETDKVLEGVRIAENWLDTSVQEHYALAVLKRSQAGENIRQQIDELDQSTTVELNRAKSNADKLLSMAAMNQALQLQLQRQLLQKTLKIIDLNGVGKPAKWNLAELRGQLENQLLGLKISTDIASSDLTPLNRLLKGAMSKAGFPATTGSADFQMVASSEVTDVGMRSGWYWLRGKVTVKLIEVGSGGVRGTHTWSFKTSADSKAVALSRMITKADEAMKDDMKKVILDFATSVGS